MKLKQMFMDGELILTIHSDVDQNQVLRVTENGLELVNDTYHFPLGDSMVRVNPSVIGVNHYEIYLENALLGNRLIKVYQDIENHVEYDWEETFNQDLHSWMEDTI